MTYTTSTQQLSHSLLLHPDGLLLYCFGMYGHNDYHVSGFKTGATRVRTSPSSKVRTSAGSIWYLRLRGLIFSISTYQYDKL